MNSACRCIVVLLALLVPAASLPASAPEARTLPFAELGDTRLVPGGDKALVILLADTPAREPAEALARAVAASQRSAAIIEVDGWLERVAGSGAGCLEAATLLDVYAQAVQRELRFTHVGATTLAGLGRGAALVPVVLAGARTGLFAAGVSAGMPPALQLPVPPCGALAGQIGWRNAEQALTLPTGWRTNAPWAAAADASPAAVLGTLERLLAGAAPADAPVDLPLVELPQPAGGTAPWFALVISGDGGWANIDRDIAEEFSQRGIAVLGWNSLRYFWKAKTPEIAAADLARALRYYTHAWNRRQVLLLGYSLGADVLPFMVSGLPPEQRAAIAGLVLLNPSTTVDFQFHVSNWLADTAAQPYPLAPEMRRLAELPVLCVYSAEDERDSLCPTLSASASTTVRQLPGDHHFDGDYAGLARVVLARFPASR